MKQIANKKGVFISTDDGGYWSSIEYDDGYAYGVDTSIGSVGYGLKCLNSLVRPFVQLS